MKLYGLPDDGHDEMGDSTDAVYHALDFNLARPLLQQKPIHSFAICEHTFEKLLEIFKGLIAKKLQDKDLLILMRVKQGNYTQPDKEDSVTPADVAEMGRQISDLMCEDSLVIWSAHGYDKYRFDFYFYEPQELQLRESTF